MRTNKLTCWLFRFRGRQWWRNIKDIPIFIHRVFFTLKHGYSPVAQFETSQWFMDVMNEIIINYRHNRVGTPIVLDDLWNNPSDNEKMEENEDAYNKILDHMIELLELMDEDNKIYDDMDWKEIDKARESAKNEFFKLFSEHFYEFWD